MGAPSTLSLTLSTALLHICTDTPLTDTLILESLPHSTHTTTTNYYIQYYLEACPTYSTPNTHIHTDTHTHQPTLHSRFPKMIQPNYSLIHSTQMAARRKQ